MINLILVIELTFYLEYKQQHNNIWSKNFQTISHVILCISFFRSTFHQNVSISQFVLKCSWSINLIWCLRAYLIFQSCFNEDFWIRTNNSNYYSFIKSHSNSTSNSIRRRVEYESKMFKSKKLTKNKIR